MAVLAPVSLSLAASSDERKMMGFPSGRTIAPLWRWRAAACAISRAARFAKSRRWRCGAFFVDSGLADRLQLEGADGMARAGNFNKACVVVEELARESCGIADVAANSPTTFPWLRRRRARWRASMPISCAS